MFCSWKIPAGTVYWLRNFSIFKLLQFYIYKNCLYGKWSKILSILLQKDEIESLSFQFKHDMLFFLNSDAAYGLMHSKSKLFQFNSNNAVLQFILEVWWLWYPHSRSLLSRGLLHSPFLSINLFNKYFCHTILRHY